MFLSNIFCRWPPTMSSTLACTRTFSITYRNRCTMAESNFRLPKVTTAGRFTLTNRRKNWSKSSLCVSASSPSTRPWQISTASLLSTSVRVFRPSWAPYWPTSTPSTLTRPPRRPSPLPIDSPLQTLEYVVDYIISLAGLHSKFAHTIHQQLLYINRMCLFINGESLKFRVASRSKLVVFNYPGHSSRIHPFSLSLVLESGVALLSLVVTTQ